jgi:hypothetical protein
MPISLIYGGDDASQGGLNGIYINQGAIKAFESYENNSVQYA